MSIAEESIFDDDIYELTTLDRATGGRGGIANRQAQQLANRTRWLKQKLEELQGLQIKELAISEEGNLLVTLGDDSAQDLGSVVGPQGIGMPAGGLIGQMPVKASMDDYDFVWVDMPVDGMDGVGISGIAINDDGHLVVALSSGAVIDAGALPGSAGGSLDTVDWPLDTSSTSPSYLLSDIPGFPMTNAGVQEDANTISVTDSIGAAYGIGKLGSGYLPNSGKFWFAFKPKTPTGSGTANTNNQLVPLSDAGSPILMIEFGTTSAGLKVGGVVRDADFAFEDTAIVNIDRDTGDILVRTPNTTYAGSITAGNAMLYCLTTVSATSGSKTASMQVHSDNTMLPAGLAPEEGYSSLGMPTVILPAGVTPTTILKVTGDGPAVYGGNTYGTGEGMTAYGLLVSATHVLPLPDDAAGSASVVASIVDYMQRAGVYTYDIEQYAPGIDATGWNGLPIIVAAGYRVRLTRTTAINVGKALHRNAGPGAIIEKISSPSYAWDVIHDPRYNQHNIPAYLVGAIDATGDYRGPGNETAGMAFSPWLGKISKYRGRGQFEFRIFKVSGVAGIVSQSFIGAVSSVYQSGAYSAGNFAIALTQYGEVVFGPHTSLATPIRVLLPAGSFTMEPGDIFTITLMNDVIAIYKNGDSLYSSNIADILLDDDSTPWQVFDSDMLSGLTTFGIDQDSMGGGFSPSVIAEFNGGRHAFSWVPRTSSDKYAIELYAPSRDLEAEISGTSFVGGTDYNDSLLDDGIMTLPADCDFAGALASTGTADDVMIDFQYCSSRVAQYGMVMKFDGTFNNPLFQNLGTVYNMPSVISNKIISLKNSVGIGFYIASIVDIAP